MENSNNNTTNRNAERKRIVDETRTANEKLAEQKQSHFSTDRSKFEDEDEMVDATMEDSFPASDPPSWSNATVNKHEKHKKESA